MSSGFLASRLHGLWPQEFGEHFSEAELQVWLGVQAAQADGKTERESLGTIIAAQFGKEQIKIEKDDALHRGIETVDAGTYRLVMKDAERSEVPVSRQRARTLRERLGA